MNVNKNIEYLIVNCQTKIAKMEELTINEKKWFVIRFLTDSEYYLSELGNYSSTVERIKVIIKELENDFNLENKDLEDVNK